jgi:uncharacterized SAM-dependent methyltransferase
MCCWENEEEKNVRLYIDKDGYFVLDKNFNIGLKGLEELQVRFDALSKYINLVASNLNKSNVSIKFDLEKIQEMIKNYKLKQEEVHRLF